MRRTLLVLIVLVALAAAASWFLVFKPTPITLDLGDLPGSTDPRPAEFESFRKITTYVTAPDGVRLAVDAFVPEEPIGNTPEDRFPTIFFYTPYSRAYALIDLGWMDRIGLGITRGIWDAIIDASARRDVQFLLSRGYAYVIADMRGTGVSEGSVVQLDSRHGSDGAAIIDWITDQSWSDGQVCMHGQSYAGWAQFAVASEAPDALKCIAPSQLFFETYTESLRPGGVLAEAWLQQFSDYLERFTDNDISRGFATAPVVDEDGDGELLDEIPINLGSGEPPLYSDHQQRLEHHYARVTEMHGANQQVDYMLDEQHAFIDAPIRFEGQDYLLVDTSPGVMLARSLLDSEIAVMHIGGLFDGFGHGAFKSYSTLAEHRFNRLFVAPRFHLPMEITDAYRELLDYSGSYADQLIFEELQFFDENMKGFSRASEAEPPIKLYVANEGWRYLDQWPPEDSQMTPLFLKRQNGLSSQAERAMSVDTYQVDWGHSSNYGSNDRNRWLMSEAPDGLMLRTSLDELALVYETPPLTEDLTVIGHPVARLLLSSNRPDADVFLYLSEVTSDGSVLNVSEGRLRLGFADSLKDDDLQALEMVDVKPDLPWHGFAAEDYNPRALADNRVVTADVGFFPVAWRFRQGHRIRLAIAGADEGNFQLNPVACPSGDPSACLDTTLEIHLGGSEGSAVRLPVHSETAELNQAVP